MAEKLTGEEFLRRVDKGLRKVIAQELERQPLKRKAMEMRGNFRKVFEKARTDGHM